MNWSFPSNGISPTAKQCSSATAPTVLVQCTCHTRSIGSIPARNRSGGRSMYLWPIGQALTRARGNVGATTGTSLRSESSPHGLARVWGSPAGELPHDAAFLRNSSARARRGYTHRAGAARPFGCPHHADLYARPQTRRLGREESSWSRVRSGRVTLTGTQVFCEARSARSRSAIKSSGSSRPTDNRTVPSVIPAARSAASSIR